LPEFEDCELCDLKRDRLQQFLDEMAKAGLSKSVVDHLRWDLNAVFKMASEDDLVNGNPAGSLVTPRGAAKPVKRRMNKRDVQLALSVLDLRERLVFLLAVLVGMRPGEIFALRWARVDSGMVEVAERAYRGLPDEPKTDRGKRLAAVPPPVSLGKSKVGVNCQPPLLPIPWSSLQREAPTFQGTTSFAATFVRNWKRLDSDGSISRCYGGPRRVWVTRRGLTRRWLWTSAGTQSGWLLTPTLRRGSRREAVTLLEMALKESGDTGVQ
jgi:hypothetical protein